MDDELKNRIDLAACYHLADYFNMSDIVWNHITCKTSSTKNTFLINKMGLRFDEITASNLLEVDLSGKIIKGDGEINYTGYVIHGAIHQARADINCVMHTHSRAGLAISCLRDGLNPMIQDSAMFYKRVSYHDWEGMSTNTDECQRLINSLGVKNVMILRNHGLLTCGTTIGQAFMLMYYLDRACKNQIDVLSMNKKFILPSKKIMDHAASQYDNQEYELGKNEWPALLRLLDKNKSIYKD